MAMWYSHPECMGAGEGADRVHCRLPGDMGIVTLGAGEPFEFAPFFIPETVTASVHSQFPIPEGWAVAFFAEAHDLGKGNRFARVQDQLVPVLNIMTVAATIIDAMLEPDVLVPEELARGYVTGGEDPMTVHATAGETIDGNGGWGRNGFPAGSVTDHLGIDARVLLPGKILKGWPKNEESGKSQKQGESQEAGENSAMTTTSFNVVQITFCLFEE